MASGLSEEQIAALQGDYAASPLFDDRDKAVIAWAEHVTLGQTASHPEAGEALKRFLDPAQIVELTYAIGLFMMNNRVHDALGLELEAPGEAARIRGTGRIDRKAFRSFVERMPGWSAAAGGREGAGA